MTARGCLRIMAVFASLGVLLSDSGRAAGQTIVGAEEVENYNRNPLTVSVSPSLSPEEVEAVAAAALAGRKWTVVERSPQRVVGALVHRDFDAKVVLEVEGTLIRILSESSYKSPSTGQFEPAIPKGWLKNLQKDLKALLAKKAEPR
jgi:hypothetical protein